MSNTTIKNKICIITGGACGIGFATAYNFLKNQAAAVVIADIGEVNGKRAISRLESEFGSKRAIFQKTDVTKSDDLESLFKSTIEQFGRFDILINNAGILQEALWMKEIEINFAAVVNSTNIAIKYLKSGAVIVNISSILGVNITPFFPVYTATKHAVIAFTTSMSARPPNQKLGIKFLTICPGFTDTQLGANCYTNDSEDMLESIRKVLQDIPLQKPESVAENITMIIENGSNGSVWIVENGHPAYETDLVNGNKLFKMSTNY